MSPDDSVSAASSTESVKSKFCTICGSRTGPGFRFCADCGAEVTVSLSTLAAPAMANARPGATEQLTPLPTTAPESAPDGARRKQRRKAWYKRPLVIVPVALLGVLLIATSVVAYRTMSAFNDVQSISTPPPEVSASILGADRELVIDTGPAQQAIRDQEVREQQQSTTSDEGANEPDQPSRFTGLTPEDEDAPAQSDLSDPESPSTPVDPSGPTSSDAESDVADSDGVNILLMGVDARDTDTIDIGVRPDSLAVLNLNEENGACRILAIPRDSRVNLPGYGASKVNHALAVGGIPYEILVVEDYLDIEIDHYALVDFSGLVQVVDALDGITVDNPEAFTLGDMSFAAGEIELDGEESLAYSRFRGGSEGDFGRISRQQQVIRGLMDEVYDVNLVRVVPNMFSILSDHFRTGFGPTDLIGLADDYRTSCTSTTIETRTIAGEVATAHDDLMQMDLSFVISDPEIVRDDVDWLLGLNEE